MKKRLLSILLFISFLIPEVCHAGGFVHGARASGMGTAFVAVADDPSAILHNPAGLTQLKGTNIYGGNTFVFPSTSYESPSGGSEETEFQVFFPPHFFLSSDLKTEKFVFGLGIHSPFGIGGRKWPDDGLTRYYSVESFIGTLSINPTVAWQALPNLSVALGIDYLLSFNQSERMLDQSMFSFRDGRMKLDCDGGAWGYNLGALLFLNEKVSLGFQYRSHIEIDHSGDATLSHIAPELRSAFGGSRFKTDISTTIDFPEIFSIAIAYRPNEKLILALDAELVRWSSFDTIEIDFKKEVPETGFTDSTAELDWKDIWVIKAGAEYRMNEKIALRCGYAYGKNPVPDRSLEPSNPDSDQHNFSVGAGYKFDKWIIDFFYDAAFYEDRNVTNTILSGAYENFTHYTGFSVGYRF